MALRLALFLVCALGCYSPLLAQTSFTGNIAGHVTDTADASLPGVKVTVIGPGFREVAITDANGRFKVEGLLQGGPATYTVTAELAGFSKSTLDNVTMAPGGVDVVITMKLGCFTSPPLRVIQEFPATLRNTDAVFLLRIDSAAPRRLQTGGYCGLATEYVGTILETVKNVGQESPTTVRFVDLHTNQRYDSRSEYVLFLYWSRDSETYVVNSAYAFPVRGGWLESLPRELAATGDAHVRDVLEALRLLSKP